ncbi:uncharacterized protein LOC130835932 [Hippopotamus amphibius kiboko]|uniref:uncharacterized protein LOC130835932 n=1 Tax=Hippopotamus amphibius kiboko TaxID=575201 RepID=UPI0025994C28|nr:uncharacterized protein LOC130835932 [Hippopotamus amphibius kiboko]
MVPGRVVQAQVGHEPCPLSARAPWTRRSGLQDQAGNSNFCKQWSLARGPPGEFLGKARRMGDLSETEAPARDLARDSARGEGEGQVKHQALLWSLGTYTGSCAETRCPGGRARGRQGGASPCGGPGRASGQTRTRGVREGQLRTLLEPARRRLLLGAVWGAPAPAGRRPLLRSGPWDGGPAGSRRSPCGRSAHGRVQLCPLRLARCPNTGGSTRPAARPLQEPRGRQSRAGRSGRRERGPSAHRPSASSRQRPAGVGDMPTSRGASVT